jgi:hypothetical protein
MKLALIYMTVTIFLCIFFIFPRLDKAKESCDSVSGLETRIEYLEKKIEENKTILYELRIVQDRAIEQIATAITERK